MFNVSNVLQPIPATTLQRQSTPPDLPVWLAPVGQTYRYESSSDVSSNIAIQFLYFSRDVPGIDESLLQIFYLDTTRGDSQWVPTETLIDPVRNQASSKIVGNGYYVLVATIEMPPVVEGWNLIGNPIPGSVSITNALSSLATPSGSGYSIIYGFDEQTQRWRAFDPDQDSFANTLTEISFGQGYWIYAEQDAEFYFPVGGRDVPQTNDMMPVLPDRTASLEPPAIFFGEISIESSGTLTPTTIHIARADAPSVICGEGVVTSSGADRFAFVVYAPTVLETCQFDANTLVTFLVDGAETGDTAVWTNRQMTEINLTVADE